MIFKQLGHVMLSLRNLRTSYPQVIRIKNGTKKWKQLSTFNPAWTLTV